MRLQIVFTLHVQFDYLLMILRWFGGSDRGAPIQWVPRMVYGHNDEWVRLGIERTNTSSAAVLSLGDHTTTHDTSHIRKVLTSGNTGIHAWERRCQSKKHKFFFLPCSPAASATIVRRDPYMRTPAGC
jgi:hypothetical protein